jgi:hypothetical protein
MQPSRKSAQGRATSSGCEVECRVLRCRDQRIFRLLAAAKLYFSVCLSLFSVLLPVVEFLRAVDAPDVGKKFVNALFAGKLLVLLNLLRLEGSFIQFVSLNRVKHYASTRLQICNAIFSHHST